MEKSKRWVEYASGTRTLPPEGYRPLSEALWAVEWVLLLFILWAFSGQSSKFIYIDF